MNVTARKAAKVELEQRLFSDPELNAYVLMDGAQITDLPGQLQDRGEREENLLSGDLDPEVNAVAARLVHIGEGDTFDWAFDNFIEQNALVFVRTPRALMDLRRQLRKLNYVEMPDGKMVFFRYYDPRVLLQVLPIATPKQEGLFYGWERDVGFLVVDETFRVVEFP